MKGREVVHALDRAALAPVARGDYTVLWPTPGMTAPRNIPS